MSSSYDPQESGSLAAAAAAVKFPDARYAGAGAYFAEYAKEMARASETIDPAAMERAGSLLVDAYARGARMFSCGNGGSAAIANHMQCDHLKGIRTGTDLAPQVLSLSTNVEVLTAIATTSATTKSSCTSCSPRPGRVTCSSPCRLPAARGTSWTR